MAPGDNDDASDGGRMSFEDRAEIRARAEKLDRRLKDARGEAAASARDGAGVSGRSGTSGRSGASGRARPAGNLGAAQALRTSTEMVAGVVVGSGIGWLLDQWLGTWPAFFIIFFLLGAAGGMLNVVRSGLKMKTGPSDRSKGPAVSGNDDDDN